ncbi:DinB family protein [Peribacillus simplex]
MASKRRWFKWCESLSAEELRAERVDGMESILKNLIHIVDCLFSL